MFDVDAQRPVFIVTSGLNGEDVIVGEPRHLADGNRGPDEGDQGQRIPFCSQRH